MKEAAVNDESYSKRGGRPVSAGVNHHHDGDSSLVDKRKSAAADISQFRSESRSHSTATSHTRSSSLLQDTSTRSTSSAMHDSSSKSASSQPRRSQSRTSRVSSNRTSSRLDTTGSSDVLDSSYEDQSRHRSSYYFGEAPDFKDILATTNGNTCDNNASSRGVISPHTGEVVRIRVPFSDDQPTSNGPQSHSVENIQRLVLWSFLMERIMIKHHFHCRLSDQQISPSYNGHKVTIKVNRSNEALAKSKSQVKQLGNYL